MPGSPLACRYQPYPPTPALLTTFFSMIRSWGLGGQVMLFINLPQTSALLRGQCSFRAIPGAPQWGQAEGMPVAWDTLGLASPSCLGGRGVNWLVVPQAPQHQSTLTPSVCLGYDFYFYFLLSFFKSRDSAFSELGVRGQAAIVTRWPRSSRAPGGSRCGT